TVSAGSDAERRAERRLWCYCLTRDPGRTAPVDVHSSTRSEPAICTPPRLVPFRALADLLAREEFEALTVLLDRLLDNLEQDRATSREHRSSPSRSAGS